MAYDPPNCNNINFSLSGSYTPPGCDEIDYVFLEDIADIVSANVNIIIPVGDSLVFSGVLIGSEDVIVKISPDITEFTPVIPVISEEVAVVVAPDKAIVRGTEPYHLPTNINASGGTFYSWKNAKPVDNTVIFPYEEAKKITNTIVSSYDTPIALFMSMDCSWKMYHTIDSSLVINYGLLHKYSLSFGGFGWQGIMSKADLTRDVPWDSFLEIGQSYAVSYRSPPPVDSERGVAWGEFSTYDMTYSIPYEQPPPVDVEKVVAWGPFSYYTLCLGGKYGPPSCSSINFKFPSKYDLLEDVCLGMTFQINNYASVIEPRCPFHHVHSGIRDVYTSNIRLIESKFPRPQEVYFMLNYVFVKEVLTNTPIEVLGVEARIDRSSWLWSFSIVVASLDCLELIAPQEGVYAHLEIQINGYTWYCTVEGWKENRSFTKDTWSITGRSPSLMFGDPINARKSYTEASDLQGQTIFDQMVTSVSVPPNWPTQFSSWDTDWSAYNNTCTGFSPFSSWYIPGGTLSYADKSDKDILKYIADGIGAYVQTDPDQNTLRVKPIYSYMPWDWTGDSENIEWRPLIEDQFKEVARSTKLEPYYQAVHVMGESPGANNAGTGPGDGTAVFVDVCRDGWCGGGTATYAPMITHPLVSSTKAGLEKGRMCLGKTGEWVNHSIRIGMLCPGNQSTGLFTPGDMVSVLERGMPWHGQVTSTVVSVARSGKGGFTVSQQIGVEEYRGS